MIIILNNSWSGCTTLSIKFAVLAIVSENMETFFCAGKVCVMRFITIQKTIAIPDECECVSRYDMLGMLNSKLQNDPGFFGQFTLENIVKVHREGSDTGRSITELLDGHTLE